MYFGDLKKTKPPKCIVEGRSSYIFMPSFPVNWLIPVI